MKTLSKYLCAVAAGTLLASGANAFDVSATVSSTITVTETTPFSLGTLYVAASDGDGGTTAAATFVINPSTGATTATDGAGADTSKFVSLGGAQVGVITVTGAQAFGSVTVDSSATPTDLVHESGNPALPVIDFTTLTTSPADGATLTLDANGDGDILVGGTFTADDSTTAAYADGVYTGTYDITVSY